MTRQTGREDPGTVFVFSNGRHFQPLTLEHASAGPDFSEARQLIHASLARYWVELRKER